MKQFKPILCMLLFIGYINPTIAQNNLDDQVKYMLDDLDKSSITSDILLEGGFKLAEPKVYDGTILADTLKDFAFWGNVYMTLRTARLHNSIGIPATDSWITEADSLITEGIVPLMGLHAKYHQFIEDTLQLDSLIYFQNGQFHDFPVQVASPYQQSETFVYSPYRSIFYDSLSLLFKLDPEFIFQNAITGTVASIQMDFDNGKGFVNMNLNSTTKTTWASFGDKYIKTKVTYSDSSQFLSIAKITLSEGKIGLAKYNLTADEEIYVPHPDGIEDYGLTLQVAYGCGNERITKPFIVAQWFNPPQWEAKEYENFYFRIDQYQENFTSSFQMLTEMNAHGYDIIFAAYDNGSGDMLLNAETLEAAIEEINRRKENNFNPQGNIVVGTSMGGIIARLALTNMEAENKDHQTDYYISFDSPHQGANVPLALQYCLDDLATYEYNGEQVMDLVPQVKDGYDVLYSTAARQMLIYHAGFTNGDNTDHTNFQAILDARGMPQNTLKNIALSNGAGDDVLDHGFSPGGDILDVHLNSFTDLATFTDAPDFLSWFAGLTAAAFFGLYYDIDLNLDAVPHYSTTPEEIYYREIFITFNGGSASDPYPIEVDHKIPYDAAPGSYIDLTPVQNVLQNFDQSNINLHINSFCFMPTFSALNIAGNLNAPYADIDPEDAVANHETTFEKLYLFEPSIYSNPLNNEAHVNFTPSSVRPFEEIIMPVYAITAPAPQIDENTFNFGVNTSGANIVKTIDKITDVVTVTGDALNTGIACINCFGPLADNSSNPLNEANNFVVYLGDGCVEDDGELIVDQFGKIQIGENSLKTGGLIVTEGSTISVLENGEIVVNENSTLTVEQGGELQLLPGSKLIINNGGKVVIREGGKLIYENNVNIELNGFNAQLALGGLTHIGENAVFTFTYQGSDNGYIRMLSEGYWGPRFSAEENARITLDGEDSANMLLYLEKDVDFDVFLGPVYGETYTSQHVDFLYMRDGIVQFEDNARLSSGSESRFFNIRFQSPSAPGEASRGVKVFRKSVFHACNLNYTEVYAPLHYLGQGYLQIKSSELFESPVEVRGQGYYIDGSDFHASPIVSKQSSLIKSIMHSKLYGASTAVTDASLTDLNVTSCTIHSNNEGIVKSLGNLNLKCSQFYDNQLALYILPSSMVNLSTKYGGGYNFFDNNLTNINLKMANDILLVDGFNELYQGQILNIGGTIDASINTAGFIEANNNTWTPGSSIPGQPDPAQLQVLRVLPSGTVVGSMPFHIGTVAPVVECGWFDPTPPPPDPDPETQGFSIFSIASAPDLPLISTENYFTNTSFDNAVDMCMASTTFIDSTASNEVAAGMFYELLTADAESYTDSINAVVEQMQWNSLAVYKSIIELLVADSTIAINSGQFDPIVQQYADVLMHFTDSVKTAQNYQRQFNLELTKAALFLTLHKPVIAGNILYNLNLCEHDSIKTILLEEQLYNINFDIIAGELSPAAFFQDTLTFELDSAIFNFPAEAFIDSSGFGSFIVDANTVNYSLCNFAGSRKQKNVLGEAARLRFELFPNPSQGAVNISYTLKEADSQGSFVVTDILGRVIYSRPIAGSSQTFAIYNLPPATYLYTFISDGAVVKTGRFLIMRYGF